MSNMILNSGAFFTEFHRMTWEFESRTGQKPECVFVSRNLLQMLERTLTQEHMLAYRKQMSGDGAQRLIMGLPVYEVVENDW